ncbi:MAG: hypothetical protein HYY33_06915 [Chloroflexi bacterium]|nr:hypothetical protein [Chloroflexota bacterium]MBI4315422.1 hypothetical protein [Chloroflexota bacterium]
MPDKPGSEGKVNIAESPVSGCAADLRLTFLTVEQALRIDRLLSEIDEYGEVHLVVQKRELRFINKVESFQTRDRDFAK